MKLSYYLTIDEKRKYIDSVFIDDMDTLDRKIQNLQSLSDVIFRGINESKYKIYSSAQREWITKSYKHNFANITAFIKAIVKNIEKNTMLSEYFSSIGIRETDLLYFSLLQHYSAPTPLIDFTTDYTTALYFATKQLKWNHEELELDDYFSLYYIDLSEKPGELSFFDLCMELGKTEINNLMDKFIEKYPERIIDNNLERQAYYFIEGISQPKFLSYLVLGLITKRGVLAKPKTPTEYNVTSWSNLNLIAQQGCFLWYNNDDIPLEEYFAQRKIDLPPIHCLEIHKSLAEYIKNKYCKDKTDDTLFPDLNKIAQNAYIDIQKNMNIKTGLIAAST